MFNLFTPLQKTLFITVCTLAVSIVIVFFCYLYVKKTEQNKDIVARWQHLNSVISSICGPLGIILTVVLALASPQVTKTEPEWQYRTKEYCESSIPNLEGWDFLREETTYSLGKPSPTQYTKIDENESIEVFTETHYRWYTYSIVTKESDWSEWTTNRRTNLPENVKEKETVVTQYGYYYFKCANCGYRMHGWGENVYCFSCGEKIPNDYGWVDEYFDTPWSEANLQDWYGTGHYYTMELDGTRWFQWTQGATTRQITKYSYMETSTENIRTSEIQYSSDPVSNQPGIFSEPVTAYYYCEKIPSTTYYYWRWSEWADCKEGEFQNDNNTQVREKP